MDDWIIIVLLVFVAFFVTRQVSSSSDDMIRILYRQAARYSVASLQDAAEVIQVLHANYAMGYLLAIKDIASSEDFERATGEDLLKFERKIASIQDMATSRLVESNPKMTTLHDDVLERAIYLTDNDIRDTR